MSFSTVPLIKQMAAPLSGSVVFSFSPQGSACTWKSGCCPPWELLLPFWGLHLCSQDPVPAVCGCCNPSGTLTVVG